jgi:hypothetical protein
MIAMVAVVGALALSFIHILRLIGTAMMHKTVRKVVERDPASAEGLLAQIGKPREQTGDDRLSVVLVAIGLAMAAATAIAVDDPGMVRAGIAASLFPLIVGAALGLRLFMLKRFQSRDPGK